MKRIRLRKISFCLLGYLLAMTPLARAQLDLEDYSPFEIYGGPSITGSGGFTNYQAALPGFRLGAGWNLSVRGNPSPLSLVGDISHYRRSGDTGNEWITMLMAGPRMIVRDTPIGDGGVALYVQALLGSAHVHSKFNGDQTFLPQEYSHAKFAGSVGTGIDVNVNRRWTFRLFELEFLDSGGTLNARLSSGVVYRFGKR